MLPHGADELHDVHGLRDVAVEARRQETLAVSLHRLRGQREHRDGGGALVRTQPAEGLDAVDVRQLDVHQHEVGRVLGRELDRLPARRRLQRAIPVASRTSRKSFMFFSLSSTTRIRSPAMRATSRAA